MYARLRLTCAMLLAVAVPSAALAKSKAFDMRTCPLDRVTFIDPWAGGKFEVQRVGTQYRYRCDSSGWVDDLVEGEPCSQFGRTILDGLLVPYENYGGTVTEPESVYAVWYVQPAAPCCGWELENRDVIEQEEISWLDDDNMLKLGDMGFAGIEPRDRPEVLNSAGERLSFGNPKFAMVCRAE